jgi:hypothetical protein
VLAYKLAKDAHKTRKTVWLVDIVNQKAEIIAAHDIYKNEASYDFTRAEDKLKISNDERFAILTWHGNPFLYDLKRKRHVKIKVGSKYESKYYYHWFCRSNMRDLRSTYLSRDNQILLFRLDRRIRYVCLKKAVEPKSLRELVAQIKKELHTP